MYSLHLQDVKETLLSMEIQIEIHSGISLGFVWCPAGNFYMGSNISDKYYDIGSIPKIHINHTIGFWISTTPILNEHVLDEKNNPKSPVHNWSWSSARKYCENLYAKLSHKLPSLLPNFHKSMFFDLPTEAQWEYAVRSGTETPWFFGNEPDLLEDFAICCGRTKRQPIYDVSTRQKAPNLWGLYDAYGLIPEYCRDEYLPYRFWEDYNDPFITSNNSGYMKYTAELGNKPIMSKVIRGGDRFSDSKLCNSFYRGREYDTPAGFVGFRIVITTK